ncbi:trypsin alpha [Musca autumnalis]|uniref:trypsin alpha n=1 Tax=Musca autumnalis TaxID=221902 RepID=UPI003CF64546
MVSMISNVMAGKRLISCALVAVLFAVASASPSSRIWGGSDANANEHPWVASVRVDNAHACVGNIISANALLVPASCVTLVATTSIDPAKVTVRVGSQNQYAGGKIVSVSSIVIHPSSGNFLHNIAVVFLTEPLEFNEKVSAIALPEGFDVEAGLPVKVAGWGLLESGASPYKLQQVSMNVLSRAECELQAGYGYQHVVCLEHSVGTGVCRGDEGAGGVNNNKLICIVSFAFGSCGTKYPDICTNVGYYLDWIHGLLA